MIRKFEVPEGYSPYLKNMVERELEYLTDKKKDHGISFQEDNMIHQLATWKETFELRLQYVAKNEPDAKMGNAAEGGNTSDLVK